MFHRESVIGYIMSAPSWTPNVVFTKPCIKIHFMYDLERPLLAKKMSFNLDWLCANTNGTLWLSSHHFSCFDWGDHNLACF